MASAKLPCVRLRHMLDAIDQIQSETGALSPDTITDVRQLSWLVERGLLIISEAAKALPAEIRAEEPDVPWKNIISIGNYLRHEYYRIKPEIMQQIVREHLPRLREAVVRLLARHGD